MTEIIIVCFIVGLALIMTIRWLRKKVRVKTGDCCSGETSSNSSVGAIRQAAETSQTKPMVRSITLFPEKRNEPFNIGQYWDFLEVKWLRKKTLTDNM